MVSDRNGSRPVKVRLQELIGPSNQPRRGLPTHLIEQVSGPEGQPDRIRIEDIVVDPVGRVRKKKRVDPGSLESEDVDIREALVHAGDLVLTTLGPQFKCAVVDEENDGALISENIIAMTLLPKYSAEYVASYLNSPFGQKELQNRASGMSHIVRISPRVLPGVEVCLPPEGTEIEVFELFRTYYEYERVLSGERETRMKIMDALLCTARGDRP
ncbi:hypothetical protein [Methanoculleus sp.]|uniref:hypothetical protein n=1 Tax=Methanoculleus sp. TaxID=90427 RepID=UPI0025D00CF5|nr:hypothetical protein [Methanoculleus sp.]